MRASIDAFNDALSVTTREANPRDWAASQNNLGNVLYSLGYRTGDQPTLQRSIDAFEQALLVYTPETEPIRWATVLSNQGGAKMALADAVYVGSALNKGRIDLYTAIESWRSAAGGGGLLGLW